MKTWLTKDESNCVYRGYEYTDEPDLIGDLVQTLDGIPHFYTMGDNRIFSIEELKQITVWLEEMKKK